MLMMIWLALFVATRGNMSDFVATIPHITQAALAMESGVTAKDM